jgi:hypothetical protein
MRYIQVVNLLSPSYLKRLQDLTGGMNGFPWFFLSEDISYSTKDKFDSEGTLDIPRELPIPEEQKTVGFTHVLMDQDGIESPFLPTFAPLLDIISDALPYPVEFFRVRLALQLANGKDSYNGPHTDHETDHYAALFYLNDSSGDTVFFHEYDDPSYGSVDERWVKATSQPYNKLMGVTPEANKLFVFNGHRFHSSSNPTTNPYRIILNLNFRCEHDLFDFATT